MGHSGKQFSFQLHRKYRLKDYSSGQSQGEMQDLIPKINKAKRAEGHGSSGRALAYQEQTPEFKL
jgi:hypothetical protein